MCRSRRCETRQERESRAPQQGWAAGSADSRGEITDGVVGRRTRQRALGHFDAGARSPPVSWPCRTRRETCRIRGLPYGLRSRHCGGFLGARSPHLAASGHLCSGRRPYLLHLSGRRAFRLGQPAPLRRFPQPASRCARTGRARDLSRPRALPIGAGFAGCPFYLPAGKHLGRPGRPVMRAPSGAAPAA
jgi:hypothetical protein